MTSPIPRPGKANAHWTVDEMVEFYHALRAHLGRRPTTQELQPHLKTFTRLCEGDIGNLYRWCGDEPRGRGRPRGDSSDSTKGGERP